MTAKHSLHFPEFTLIFLRMQFPIYVTLMNYKYLAEKGNNTMSKYLQ